MWPHLLNLVDCTLEPSLPLDAGKPVSVTLRARMSNQGNRTARTMATVRFYAGDPNAGGQLIATAQPVHLPGCGATTFATATWMADPAEFPLGDLYAVVTAENHADVDASNNRGSAPFLFRRAKQIYLPVVAR